MRNNIRANKGEWSEFYAFLKILADKQLPAADKNLNPITGKFFVFRKVIREEIDEPVKIYDISEFNEEIFLTDKDGSLLKKITSIDLNLKTSKIFERIRDGQNTTFEIPEAKAVMSELLCTKVKASNDKKLI